jgi:hypothetical protein
MCCLTFKHSSCNLSEFWIHSKADFADPRNIQSNPRSFRRECGKIGLSAHGATAGAAPRAGRRALCGLCAPCPRGGHWRDVALLRAAAAVSTQLRSCCCVFGLEYRGSGAMGQGASRAHGPAGGLEKASPVTPSRCLVRSTCRFGARRPPLDSAWSLVSKLFFSPCPRARRDASARESGSVSVRQGRRALKL